MIPHLIVPDTSAYDTQAISIAGASIIARVPMHFYGPAGCGKTTLLAAVMQAYAGDRSFFVSLNPTMPGSRLTGMVNVSKLSAGEWEITPMGTARDPRNRILVFDELGRAGSALLAAVIGIADPNTGPLIPIFAASNGPFEEFDVMSGDEHLEALIDRFGEYAIQSGKAWDPNREAQGQLRRARAIDHAMQEPNVIFHAGEIVGDIGYFPTWHEMDALFRVIKEAWPHADQRYGDQIVGPSLREGINKLILTSLIPNNITVNHRRIARLLRAIIMLSLFERWRTMRSDAWKHAYEQACQADKEQDESKVAQWWKDYEEYVLTYERDRMTQSIDAISPEWASFLSAVLAPPPNQSANVINAIRSYLPIDDKRQQLSALIAKTLEPYRTFLLMDTWDLSPANNRTLLGLIQTLSPLNEHVRSLRSDEARAYSVLLRCFIDEIVKKARAAQFPFMNTVSSDTIPPTTWATFLNEMLAQEKRQVGYPSITAFLLSSPHLDHALQQAIERMGKRVDQVYEEARRNQGQNFQFSYRPTI